MTRSILRLCAILCLSSSCLAPATGEILRGVNLSGLATPGEQTPRPEAIDYYKRKGFKVFRIPLEWELIQPKLGAALDPTTLIRLRSVIAQAGSSATIIIDIHNFGRYRGKVIGQTSTVTLAHFADLWIRLAQNITGSNVVYSVMNEPHDMTDDQVVAVMSTGIAAIRNAGRTNLILVTANNWSNGASLARGATNWALLSKIRDRGNNRTIDYHVYFDAYSVKAPQFHPGGLRRWSSSRLRHGHVDCERS